MATEREDLIDESITSGNLVYIESFFQNPEEIGFILENFDSFTKPLTKVFSLLVIAFWYKERPEVIMEGFNEAINSFFFEKLIPNFSALEDELKFNVCISAAEFIIANYPGNIPDFWTTLFQLDENFVKLFLLAFMKETAVLSIKRLDHFAEIKATMKEDGTSDAILSWIFENLEKDPVILLKILHKYCYWCNIEFIGNETIVSLLQTALGQEETAALVLDVFNVVITRLANAPERDQVISMLCDPETLVSLVTENPENYKLHSAVGRLIYTVGILISEQEIMFAAAIQLLETSPQAIQAVVPFICTYIRSQGSTFETEEIISSAFQRIAAFFEDESLTVQSCIVSNSFLMALSKIIVSCWIINSESAISTLTQILQGSEVSVVSISSISIICKAMTEEKKIEQEFIDSVFQYCSPILELSAPFTQDNLTAFYLLIQLFFNSVGKINLDIIPEEAFPVILASFTNIVFNEEVDEELKDIFIELFNKFAVVSGGKIPPQQEIITALLSAGNHKYVEVGGSLMASNEEFCRSQTSEVIKQLTEAIDGENRETILSPLAFLGTKAGNFSAQEEAVALLTTLQEACGDDETLAYFAQAAEKVYNDNCPQFFSSIIDRFNSPKAVCYLTRACKLHLKRGTTINESDFEWLNVLIKGIFNNVSALIDVNEGLRQKIRDIEESVANFVFIAKCQFQYIFDEIKEEMFAFAATQFQRTPDSIITYDSAISLLSEYVTSSMENVIEVISPAPQSICFAQTFDSLSKDLPQIIQTLKSFFKKIHMRAQEAFSEILNETSGNFGLDSDAVLDFFLKRDSMKEFSKDDSRLFFQKLILMRCSSGI